MKLTKLSLATIAVAALSTNIFAADSLADMFKEGTIKGTLSSYYFSRDKGVSQSKTGVKSADILDFGLDLSYKSGNYKGFTIGATFQSTHSPFASDAAKTIFKSDMDGSGEVLSEAYIKYENSGVFLKAGRQYIDTPLLSGSSSMMTTESFEGYLVGYTGLSDTTIATGYITKAQGRTDKKGNIASFTNIGVKSDGSDSNVYTAYISNSSISGLKLQGQLLSMPENYDLYYVQADYAGNIESLGYDLAGQYNITDYDSKMNSSNSGYYGIKAGITMSGLSLHAAYSKINDDSSASHGILSGSDNIFTGANTLNRGSYIAGEKAYATLLTYKFNKDIKVYGYYGNHDLPTAGKDFDIKGAGAAYNFEGSLEGLGLSARYEVKSPDSGKDDTELRLKAIYTF